MLLDMIYKAKKTKNQHTLIWNARKIFRNYGSIYTSQARRAIFQFASGFWGRFLSQARTIMHHRVAARMVPNFAQPIILACGTCASAKISRHLVGAWLYVRHCAKIKSTSTIQYKLS